MKAQEEILIVAFIILVGALVFLKILPNSNIPRIDDILSTIEQQTQSNQIIIILQKDSRGNYVKTNVIHGDYQILENKVE